MALQSTTRAHFANAAIGRTAASKSERTKLPLCSLDNAGRVGHSAPVFHVEIRLHAVSEDVSPEELRAFYKANECPMLDKVLERSPSLRLGTTEIALPGTEGARGPAGRVDDLISLRGTTDWPPTALPLLDDGSERDVLAAFEVRESDPPFERTPVSQLVEFLVGHRGSGLATTSRSVE